MKRVLVTGGLGFIGSNFIRYALQHRNWQITNIDCQTYAGNPENLREFEENPRYRWIKADITEQKKVVPLVSESDIIIHFAAETHVDRSILDSQAFLKTNVLGTSVLLEASRRSKIELFLHVSTDEVYGSVEKGTSSEEDPLWPNSPYAASKAASDLLVRSYFVTHKLPVMVTRCSNNFGPYQFPEKALPLLITNAFENKPFPLYGSGENIRDWIYVLDHVNAILFLLEKGQVGEAYNIGTDCSLTNIEFFSRVLDLMKKSRGLICPVTDRPGHDKRYALNFGKLKSLGWKSEFLFETALLETIEWYKNNKDWWTKVKQRNDFQEYYKKQYAKNN